MSSTLAPLLPQVIADQAVEDLLQLHYSQDCDVIRCDSPPGAGKTWITERLAVMSKELLEERVLIAVQTNAQAIDLVTRLCLDFPKISIHMVHSSAFVAPGHFGSLPNLRLITRFELLEQKPCIVISTSAKCSWAPAVLPPFDVLIVDEAFQLPEYRFHVIANLGKRHILIGDPGQIDPVVTADIERWQGEKTAPHIPCPEALLARHPGLPIFRLPVSRRLRPDTVDFIQPAFYPQHPFSGLVPRSSRRLLIPDGFPVASGSFSDVLQQVHANCSLLQIELPEQKTQDLDQPLIEGMVAFVEQLLSCGASIEEDGQSKPLEASDIGIACAHIIQVAALQERLGTRYPTLYIETCDRFQGLERAVMLVYHPLSGRSEADSFRIDTGRMCVALSRHRVACFIFSRAGVESMLRKTPASGERILEDDKDAFFQGRQTHLRLLCQLRNAGRIVPIQEP